MRNFTRNFVFLSCVFFGLYASANSAIQGRAMSLSPTYLSTNGDEFIAIDDGESEIGDLAFENQKDLTQEILDSAADLEASVEFFSKTFDDINGKKGELSLQAELGIDREVYFRNYGETDSQGNPLSPLKSVYTIRDEARHELQFEPRIELNSVINFLPFDMRAGIKVQRLYDVDDYEDYIKRRTPEESLAEVGISFNTEQSARQFENSDTPRFFETLSKALGAVENIISNTSNYFADEDRTKIFFANLLEPLRLDYEFFRVTADKIKNSTSLKPGEILIHTSYLIGIPAGIGINNSGFDLDIQPVVKKILLHSAFKKLENGQVVAKSILEVRNERRVELEYGIGILGLEPLKTRLSLGNYHAKEYGYELDLNNNEHEGVFNDVFARRWFTKDAFNLPKVIEDFETLQNEDYVGLVRDSANPRLNLRSRFRIETGILSYDSETNKKLDKTTTEVDGTKYTEYMGVNDKETDYAFRVFEMLREERETKKSLQSYVLVDENNNLPKVELLFDYIFKDEKSSKMTIEQDVNTLKMAMAADVLANNSQKLSKLKTILDSRIAVKRDREDKQNLGLRIALSKHATEAIFTNPNSVEHLKYFVGRLFLGDRYQNWNDDIVRARGADGKYPDDCSNIVHNPMSGLVFNRAQAHNMSCFRLKSMAHDIVSRFKTISQSQSSATRLGSLNDLFYQKNYRPFIPMLIVKLATIKRIENGKPIYKNIDQMIEDKIIGFELVVNGSDLDGAITEYYNETEAAQPIKTRFDFDILEEENRVNLIEAEGVYVHRDEYGSRSPAIYMHFNSPVNFSENYNVKGEILNYNFIRSDDRITDFEVKDIIPKSRRDNGFRDASSYSYVFVIPQGVMEYKKDEDYVIRFQVTNSSGGFVSERQEIKFTLKK